MAATYTLIGTNIVLPTSAAAATLLKIYNTHATIKMNITRVWVLNTNLTVVTAVYQTLSLGRFTTDQNTALTAIVPIKHDTSTALGITYTAGSKPSTSVTLVDTFRTLIYSGDEFVNNIGKSENLQALPMFGLLWDSGYADSTVEPIVLNQNEGLAVTSAGVASGVGQVDVIFEFWAA